MAGAVKRQLDLDFIINSFQNKVKCTYDQSPTNSSRCNVYSDFVQQIEQALNAGYYERISEVQIRNIIDLMFPLCLINCNSTGISHDREYSLIFKESSNLIAEHLTKNLIKKFLRKSRVSVLDGIANAYTIFRQVTYSTLRFDYNLLSNWFGSEETDYLLLKTAVLFIVKDQFRCKCDQYYNYRPITRAFSTKIELYNLDLKQISHDAEEFLHKMIAKNIANEYTDTHLINTILLNADDCDNSAYTLLHIASIVLSSRRVTQALLTSSHINVNVADHLGNSPAQALLNTISTLDILEGKGPIVCAILSHQSVNQATKLQCFNHLIKMCSLPKNGSQSVQSTYSIRSLKIYHDLLEASLMGLKADVLQQIVEYANIPAFRLNKNMEKLKIYTDHHRCEVILDTFFKSATLSITSQISLTNFEKFAEILLFEKAIEENITNSPIATCAFSKYVLQLTESKDIYTCAVYHLYCLLLNIFGRLVCLTKHKLHLIMISLVKMREIHKSDDYSNLIGTISSHHNFDPNLMVKGETTLCHLAAEFKDTAVVKALCSLPLFNPDITNKQGEIALFTILDNFPEEEAMKLARACKWDMNATNALGQTIQQHCNIYNQKKRKQLGELAAAPAKRKKTAQSAPAVETGREPSAHHQRHVRLNLLGQPRTPNNITADNQAHVTEVWSTQKVYEMRKARKGKVLIICNSSFSVSWLRNLDGYRDDRDRQVGLWSGLGFEVYLAVCEDGDTSLSGQEMTKAVQIFSRQLRADDQCAVLVVLTHGREGFLYGCDGASVARMDLISHLDNQRCSAMMGKPKIVIFQACNGSKQDMGVPVTASGGEPSVVPAANVESLPTVSDMVICSPSLPGYVSYVYNVFGDGSVFIKHLTEIVAREAAREDFLSLMTMVNYAVSDHVIAITRPDGSEAEYKQMSEFRSSLRKKLYLFPCSGGSQGNDWQ